MFISENGTPNSHNNSPFNDSRKTSENRFVAIGGKVVSVQKELLAGTPATATRKIGLGGRKMMVDKVLKKDIEKEENLNEGTSPISGAAHFVGKCYFKRKGDLKKNINMLETKKVLKSASLGISKSEPVHPLNTSSHHSQDSKANSTKASSDDSSSRSDKPASQKTLETAHKDEAQRLLEAAKEIVNLMHKDYSGMNQPRRNPPINNHEPSN
ncbi:hypothetical protein L1049_003326 [Liquidambar formosana]|uniref:Uncharacterized protein n=1 Tax=Liquidambar formosana TaxID=63359 RepID=A0AAP0NJK5_LIQFO